MENEKKINKKIVYSIVAIFIIIGIIVGATYAYFSARSNTERQTVTTAKMSLDITPKDAEIIGKDLMPITEAQISSKAAKKTFTVTSENNVDIAVNMGIEVESITENLAVADFKWEIYEGTDNSGTKVGYGTFYGAKANDTISTNSAIFAAPGESKTYTMYVYILETGKDQNSMQSGSFNFKIYAEGLFDQVASTVYEEDSLAYNLLGNVEDIEILNNPLEGTSSVAYNNSNNGISLMSNSATPMANANNYKGIYKTIDNDGVTYYFTGDVGNNYVVFGDHQLHSDGTNVSQPTYSMTFRPNGDYRATAPSSVVWQPNKDGKYVPKYLWRIVRINGDGTIRLVLNSLIHYNDRKISQNGWNHWDIKGWSYGGSAAYENSQMDTDLQFWYDNRSLNASGLVVPSKYCVDNSRSATGNSLSYTCNNEITRNIGLLTETDLEYSGFKGKNYTSSKNSYLEIDIESYEWGGNTGGCIDDATITLYTMTPYTYTIKNGTVYNNYKGIMAGPSCDTSVQDIPLNNWTTLFLSEDDLFIRPVINIKADALISSGNGTYASPYVIEY